MILCAVLSQEGRLSRYETGGERPRLTHQYQHEYNGKAVPAVFAADVVEEMRLRPPPHLRVQEEETETGNDGSPEGGTPIAARQAA